MTEVRIPVELEEELYFRYRKEYSSFGYYGVWLQKNLPGFLHLRESEYDNVIYTILQFDTEENAALFKMRYMT